MEVDAVRIREHQLHKAERIPGAGLLADLELSRPQLLQNVVVDFARGHNSTLLRHDLVEIFGDVATMLYDGRHNLGTLNAARYIPIRPEDKVGHVFRKHRGLMSV